MNQNALENLEAAVRGARPAVPPAEFLQRVKSATRSVMAERAGAAAAAKSRPSARQDGEAACSWWWLVARWLVPAAAVLMVAAAAWGVRGHGRAATTAAARSPMKADKVQIDEQLVATFDAVAPLPDGEPVRFRCREWMDEVVLRDSKSGTEVARRVPRIDVVPVRFEVY